LVGRGEEFLEPAESCMLQEAVDEFFAAYEIADAKKRLDHFDFLLALEHRMQTVKNASFRKELT